LFLLNVQCCQCPHSMPQFELVVHSRYLKKILIFYTVDLYQHNGGIQCHQCTQLFHCKIYKLNEDNLKLYIQKQQNFMFEKFTFLNKKRLVFNLENNINVLKKD